MIETLNPNILPEMAVVVDRSTAAIVSSVRSEWGKYFAVMEPPRPQRHDFLNEVKRRANLFRLCKFTTLLQTGLSEDVAVGLNSSFSPSEVRVVHPDDPLFLPTSQKPPLQFRPNNAIAALFQALRTKRTLVIDETAPDLSIANDFPSDRLIVVEDADEIGAIVAVNLASYLGAHIKILPCKSRDDVHIIQDLFRRYDGEKESITKPRIAEDICSRLDIGIAEAELLQYSYCIFFSKGLVYGAAIKQVPTGHFFISLECGLQVLRNIAVDPILRTALIVDPSQLNNSETQDVETNLTERGTYVQTLIGQSASYVDVDFNLRELPYDYIFFVAHGGFPKGNRLKVAFKDSLGDEHTIVLRKTYSFSPVLGTDKFLVASFTEPESIDGLSWRDPDKTVPQGTEFIVLHLDEALESGVAKITDSERDIEMRFCNCIRLREDNYFAACDAFGSMWGPVVVNNICNSIHYLSELFVFGGARVYIGTLYSVLDPLASEFVRELVRTKMTLGDYVKAFNDSHFANKPLSCYIIYGLPTHRINFANGDNRAYFFSEVEWSLARLVKFRSDNPFHKMHEQIDWTINHLKAELHQKPVPTVSRSSPLGA